MSVVLYPLFVPTYGIALFCYAMSHRIAAMPIIWTVLVIMGTFLLTCVIPISAIWLMVKAGKVSSMQIEDSSERTIPYIYSAVGFGCWAYLLIVILHTPTHIGLVAVGGTVAIGLVALINRVWKISAHLTGFGGLVGGWFSFCLGSGIIPTWGAVMTWFIITLSLMYARLYLQAHTSGQVIAGWLLGIVCTSLPYFCIVWVGIL